MVGQQPLKLHILVRIQVGHHIKSAPMTVRNSLTLQTMDKHKLHIFVESITSKTLEAGKLAIDSQGKVTNLKKEINIDKNVPQIIKDRVQAKTEIDEKVQEILLSCVQNTLGTRGIKIDAEEDTPSVSLFNDLNTSLTVVIDPIDGTLEYVNGKDEYSINIGLIENGMVLTTLVYFPKWKKLFFLDENKKSYEITYDDELAIKTKKELSQPKVVRPNIVYTNNRVPELVIENLRKIGITVIEDDGKVSWPESLLKCISGEFSASIFHTPQIRDVLLGALINGLSAGFMMDWQGKNILWPDGGRIPRVIFGVGNLSSEVIKCLDYKD